VGVLRSSYKVTKNIEDDACGFIFFNWCQVKFLRSNDLKDQQAPNPGRNPGLMDVLRRRPERTKALLSRDLYLLRSNKCLKRSKYKEV
jgi:hypothetical protein